MIVEYAMVEEIIVEGSTDAGLVEKPAGEVPVEIIPLTEDP